DDKHVVYVWLDALTNYITGIGYDVDGNSSEQFAKNWPADLHLIGKDIIRFHTIYWPIFLMSLDLPLPKQVFGHPWLLQGDGKMSKSKGNVIYAEDLIGFFGVDAVRYFVLHEMPFENDGVITWDLMVERLNSDLANILGNLVNRTISMSNKYFGGVVENKNVGVAEGEEDVDASLKLCIADTYARVAKKMDVLRVADAISEIFVLFKRLNKYIDETMPWALAKDEAKQDRLSTVLYNLLNGILVGASLLEPFMPETAEKIAKQICTDLVDFELLEANAAISDDEKIAKALYYPAKNKVTETPEILFARQDLKEVLEKVEAMFAERNKGKEEVQEAKEEVPENVIDIEAKEEISYDLFAQCQFQVGEIIDCKEVPKSKKLLCSQVRIGSQVRQILSGIKQHYTPEEMVGKKVMVLVNLQPRQIAGMMSEGMLLCAEDAEGKLALMTPEKDMPAGAEIC
ncbi:methionine--tRNA ligase subunit beta, partial [Treponema sp.]|uniref:methionine--tRNA ligase subunit beta n=1 Tax=Treponema sp. TaxID=166 RepID=UPI00298E2102